MSTPANRVRRPAVDRPRTQSLYQRWLHRRLMPLVVLGALVGSFLVPAAASADPPSGGATPPSSIIPPPPDLLNLSAIDAPPPPLKVSVGGNLEPVSAIGTGEFYATPAQIGSLQDFEEQAVEDTVNARDFATGDYDTVLSWDRGDADALLFGLIDDAMTTAPGGTIPGETLISAGDVENVDAWFTAAMQRQDQAAAQEAGLEYTRWAGLGIDNYLSLLNSHPSETDLQAFLSSTPNTYTDGYSPANPPTVETSTSTTTPGYDANGGYCTYEPPSPDQGQYEGNIFHDNNSDVAPQLCYSNCTSIEGCPPPTPGLAQFESWGAADLTAKESSQSYVDQLRSVSTGAAVLGAIAAVAVPAGVAIPAALPTAALAPIAGSAFQQAVFPFAARAYFTGSGGLSANASEVTEAAEASEAGDVAEGEAATDAAEGAVDGLEIAGGAVAATGVGVIIGAVLFAVATAIQEGITIIGGDAVPGELAQIIAPPSPPAINLPTVAGDPTQLTAAYALFLQATAPAPSNTACLNTTETEAANGAAFSIPGVGNAPSGGLSDGDYLSQSGNGSVGATYAPCGNQTPVPTPSSADPNWLVTPAGSTTATPTANLSYDYTTPAAGSTSASTTTLSAYLSGNWVVATASPDGVNSATVQSSRLSYTDWAGNEHVAEVYDDSSQPYFIDTTSDATSPPLNLSTCVADGTCSVTSTIQALDSNGSRITVGVTPSTRDTSITLSPYCYLGGCYSPPTTLPPSTSPITFPNPGTDTEPLMLTISPSTAVAGQPITLSATLPVGGASGTVTFSVGSDQLCVTPVTEDDSVTPAPVTGSGGVTVIYEGTTSFQSGASCLTQYPAGPETITAAYSGGPRLYLDVASTLEPASTSIATTVVDPTATTVEPLGDQPAGTTFPVSATVRDYVSGGPSPTGTISFSNGANPLCTVAATPVPGDAGNSSGTCSIVVSSAGVEDLRATYNGDAATSASVSLQQPVPIDRAATSLTLTPSTTDPVVGQPLQYTATLSVPADVAPAVGTVSISSQVGNFACGQAPLTSAGEVNGDATYTATCTGAFIQAGSVEADAYYSGDTNTAPSPVVADDSVTVGQASTSTAVALTTIGTSPANGASPAAGEPVVYTATVTALSPSTEGPPFGGTVEFSSGGNPVCRSDLGPTGVATCSTTAGAPGSPAVTAIYLGSNEYIGSTATINPTVTNPGSTTTILTSDPNPVVGEPVTYTADVTSTPSDAQPPTGVVVFYFGDNFQCASSLTGTGPTRAATCTITPAAPTSTLVSVSYSGSPDGTVLPSQDQLPVDVGAAASGTSVTSSLTSPIPGQPTTFTATVVDLAPDTLGPAPTGAVTFTAGNVTLCANVALSPTGTATCTKAFKLSGPKTVTATYSGDPGTQGSSGSASVTVPAMWSGPAAAGLSGVTSHDPAGFYLGLGPDTANQWKLYVTQPGAHPVGHYSGTITVDHGALKNVIGLLLEHGDTFTHAPGSSTITFSFTNVGDLDGIGFTTPANASTLTLDLYLNGVQVNPSAVHLGPSGQAPAAVPVVISR